MGHDLTIIVMQNLLFIGSYGIDMNVIHLFIFFKHWCHAHCLTTNVICLFVLFTHGCCMHIHIVYTRKLCTQLPSLNNALPLCLNNMNLWNNKFCMDLEQTHEAYKFVMYITHMNFHLHIISWDSQTCIFPSWNSIKRGIFMLIIFFLQRNGLWFSTAIKP
jgi:hypothetical protein